MDRADEIGGGADTEMRARATREILEVIGRSRDDEGPVFDVILKNALRLCDVDWAVLCIANAARSDVVLTAVAGTTTTEFRVGVDSWPMHSQQNLVRAVAEKRMIHTPDMRETDLYRAGDETRVAVVDKDGMRTQLALPLMQRGEAIGSFVFYRRKVLPFDDAEIALLETFAAQAVIAIENVRQFRELQTRLEREAATSEILDVIARSRDDEAPVFDTILVNAARLCNAPFAGFNIANEARTHLTMVAHVGQQMDYFAGGETVWPMDADLAPAIATRELRVVHIEDLKETEGYRSGDPIRVATVDVEGIRTILAVPLIKGGEAFGCIGLYHREVKPFTADQIALVETFAAQAVIAIENVRQFRELQARLEREAATGQVLDVISRSRDDDQPVFRVILENAARQCSTSVANLAVLSDDGRRLLFKASHGRQIGSFTPGETEWPADGEQAIAVAVRSGEIVHIPDFSDTDLYRAGDPTRLKLVDDEGIRSVLAVPLLGESGPVGVMALHRDEPGPFSETEIALIRSFAAQAVIAIENVRQFRELQTRLEREAASREILGVISRSRDDATPVFDTLLACAQRLCGASNGAIILGEEGGGPQVLAAQTGASEETLEQYRTAGFLMDPGQSLAARAILERRTLYFEDVKNGAPYHEGMGVARRLVEKEGIRTSIFVPLISGGKGVGCLNLHHRERHTYSEDQIALVETFAAQAVIAIENVRQFRALEARTEEVQALNAGLEERVAEQVGEIARMGKLKRFLPAAVADAVVSSGSDKLLKSHRALLGILFCDIRGFTAFCETAEPEETMAVLQAYHQEMGRLIADSGAGVDHRMGDGIMVLFNDPLPCDDPAGAAVRLAMAMRARMVELCRDWKKLGHRLGFGVGVSLGYATVGMVGYEGRSEYTASGTAVNLAARLCDHAEDGEILLSPRAAIAVEDHVICEPGGTLDLKGLSAPVEVMRAVALRQGPPQRPA